MVDKSPHDDSPFRVRLGDPGLVIPELDVTTEALPLGRYLCTTDEVLERYVDDTRFSQSSTRRQIFLDWLKAKEMIDDVGPDLVESTWVGGSFVTGRLDPDDIDCMFLINSKAFYDLPSNRKRSTLREFNKKGWLRGKTGLRVESFILVREEYANPWFRDTVIDEAREYAALRGAWDDWWLRISTNATKEEPPKLEDAAPRRGYLEVMWQ